MNIQSQRGSSTVTLIGALIVAVLAIILLAGLFTSGSKLDPEVADEISTAGRIQPIGQVKVSDGIPAGSRTGEQVFEKVCSQCHAADSTTANSPKFGNTADWAPRIAKGFDALKESSINGFANNAMPARGGASYLTDDELARAVAYMANSAGAKFVAPEVTAEEPVPAEDAAQ